MNEMELEALKVFALVINFIGSKATNNAALGINMLTAFRNLRCKTSIKTHHLFSHRDQFSENLGSVSSKQRERVPGIVGCSHDG